VPEQPVAKARLHPVKARADVPSAPERPACRYAELHCVTNFSFQRGASHPDELVNRAVALGYHALAITDRHSLAGVVRAHVAAKAVGLELLIGAEIPLEDAATVVLLAVDRAGYGELSKLLTLGRRRAEKGSCTLFQKDLEDHARGLVAIGLADEEALRPDGNEMALRRAAARLSWIGAAFGDRAHLAVELFDGPDDTARLLRLDRIAAMTGLSQVAAGGIDAHVPERRALRDVLLAIGHGCTVAELGGRAPRDGVRALRDGVEIGRIFGHRPEMLERSLAIADRCTFSLDELKYEYPVEGNAARLRELVEERARSRWGEGMPAKVRGLVEHELALIRELDYERYFLTVYEIVTFARSRGILCQGRGSAANSAVCFILGITSVDPERIDLLFERFVSRDRNEPPDIDVDFEHERREEVLQHVYERYGRERAALAATVITYRARSAVRDVGKALGLTLDQVDRLAGSFQWWDSSCSEARLREAGFDPADPTVRRVVALSGEIQGFPRHLSQHVGGMVITAGRLDEIVPIENAAMEDRTVIQWDKDDLDALGLLKVDCLALGMLTAIRRAFQYVEETGGARLTLDSVPAEDPEVYRMLGRADSIGVFQVESRAQMAMLPRLKPMSFYDLVIEVAIVRPGPIQGGMVHPYLRRREGLEPVVYPSEAVRSVLEKTLGVPIFQEQAMRIAVVAAGFTPGEADQLRRAMGAWRKAGLIESFEKRLVEGMLARGYSEEFARAVFRQILGFGEYGFPESHAASFALLTYVSSWLKRYEPACFTAALLNSQPMGFYAPAQLVRDAREHGVEVRPVDVTRSVHDCSLESRSADDLQGDMEECRPGGRRHEPSSPVNGAGQTGSERAESGNGPALRLGFRVVKGLSKQGAERIVAARRDRPFLSVEDCCRRAGLSTRDSKILADCGGFDSLSRHRRQAWWDAALDQTPSALLADEPLFEQEPDLEAASLAELVVADYRTCSLSLLAHPLSLLRDDLSKRGCRPIAEIKTARHGELIRIAGLVINRQRPATASGILFMTLEDESGYANLIVRLKEQERFRRAILGSRLLAVRGRVERAKEVVHVLVIEAHDLSSLVRDVNTSSRDFH
jgi:error-prone DNA polymerase